jgi:hypothetical protein
MTENKRYKWSYTSSYYSNVDFDYDIIDMVNGEVVFSSNSPFKISRKLKELNKNE